MIAGRGATAGSRAAPWPPREGTLRHPWSSARTQHLKPQPLVMVGWSPRRRLTAAGNAAMHDDLAATGLKLEASYSRLPSALFEPAEAAGFPRPAVVVLNHALAHDMGLDFTRTSDEAMAALFTGQALPGGARPIAQAYAGHQYGHFTMLGDGRALLIGEHVAPGGRRLDIHLKGSGETPFARRGDGRAALGPMLREYIVSEAMHALGIPTTRSLAVSTTGEMIAREGAKKGAVLTRVAASHIRVGTFQYAAAIEAPEVLRALADHAIARHDPQFVDSPARYADFLRAVVARQAELVAKWQCVGFVHGVLNTDNTLVSGETIDYGPCAFMDVYNPNTVFSSIDHHGRYRYGHQPAIIQWNLSRFAEAMLPLLSDDEPTAIALANEALEAFAPRFRACWLEGMRAKIGLASAEPEDLALVQELFGEMQAKSLDFTLAFRALSEDRPPEALAGWIPKWHARLAREARPRADALRAMRAVNPAIIPRNHRVEEALSAAERQGDLAPLHALVAALARPFDPAPEHAKFAEPPPPEFTGYCTFCGT